MVKNREILRRDLFAKVVADPKQDSPLIRNLTYNSLGRIVIARHNEIFKGISNIEITDDLKVRRPVKYSNVPIVLSLDELMREETNGKFGVISPEDVVRYVEAFPDKEETYAVTNSVVVYPRLGTNEDLRKRACEIIGLRSSSDPIIISGLGVERSDNNYGFTFKATDNIESIDASFLNNHYGKLTYKGPRNRFKTVGKNEKGIYFFALPSLRGLTSVYRTEFDMLDATATDLASTNEDGRIQIIQLK